MIFNITSIVDWRIVTATKQRKSYIDNVRKNARQFRHDYVVADLVHVKKKGIQRRLYYKKQGPYIITESFIDGNVQVQRGDINERIKIRWIVPQFKGAEKVT